MNERKQSGTREDAVVAGTSTRSALIAGSVGVAAIVLATQAILVGTQLNAGALDPAFCAPGLLHTTVELPETQLTRDFMAIRLLLKDPSDHFDVIRMLYEGELQAPELRRTGTWLSKRSDRGRLRITDASIPKLKKEAIRIDAEYALMLEASISDSLLRRDRFDVEVAFRKLFSVLLDELLSSISRQIDEGDAATASRLFPHARRYYTEALEAYLALKHPDRSAVADHALAAMSRALETVVSEPRSSKDWFEQERGRFIGAIRTAANET